MDEYNEENRPFEDWRMWVTWKLNMFGIYWLHDLDAMEFRSLREWDEL